MSEQDNMPGPGEYESSQSTLGRKTFNSTLTNQKKNTGKVLKQEGW